MNDNPYEPPTTEPATPPPSGKQIPPLRIGAIVVLGILSVPAACIAFFFACAATIDMNSNFPLWAGTIAALCTMGVFGFLIYIVFPRR